MENKCIALIFLLFASCSPTPSAPAGFQGVVEYDERVVSFEVPGRIVIVPVHKGDAVKTGDVLAQLDDTLEKLTKDARASDVEVAKADLVLLEAGTRKEDIASVAAQIASVKATEEVQQKNLDRASKLLAAGSLPQSDVDKAQADLDRTKGERRSLEAKLLAMQKGARPEELARAKARVSSTFTAVALEDERLGRHTVKSLTEGVVIDVHVKPGELAAAGTPVATLADLQHPYVDVFVPQANLDGIRVGAAAEVKTDASKQALGGKVEWISPKTEFTPRFLFSDRERPNLVVRVRVRVEDPENRLHAGVPAFVSIRR
jgi:HlyD family secretion protein